MNRRKIRLDLPPKCVVICRQGSLPCDEKSPASHSGFEASLQLSLPTRSRTSRRAVSALESDLLLEAFRLLEALPGWLISDGVLDAMERCIPEFASGALALRKVR